VASKHLSSGISGMARHGGAYGVAAEMASAYNRRHGENGGIKKINNLMTWRVKRNIEKKTSAYGIRLVNVTIGKGEEKQASAHRRR